MKISLSSLCLILTLTFSALACNQSDPFNQNANSSEKIKIDSSIGSDNAEKIKTGLGENANNNKYKNRVKTAVIRANIAALIASYGFIAHEPTDVDIFSISVVLNGLSALNLDATKHSKTNFCLGLVNFIFGSIYTGLSLVYFFYDGDYISSSKFIFHGVVVLGNAAYRLSYV